MHRRHPDFSRSDALMPEGRAMLGCAAREALCEAAAALDRAERQALPLPMSLALTQMARCLRALQAPVPAESYLERALSWARLLGAADAAVDILCLLAETGCAIAELRAAEGQAQRHAVLERTRDRAFEAVALAAHVADAQWEVTVLLRISDVLDRCGDHDDAVQLQSRAMCLMYGDWVVTGDSEASGTWVNMLADHRA